MINYELTKNDACFRQRRAEPGAGGYRGVVDGVAGGVALRRPVPRHQSAAAAGSAGRGDSGTDHRLGGESASIRRRGADHSRRQACPK